MDTAFIVLHTIFAIFLVCVILLQPGKGDAGIGFGSSSQSIFGSAGAGNFLTKLTAVCAFLFLLTSFSLTKRRMDSMNSSVITADAPVAETAKPVDAPKAADPVAPAEPAKK